jgi:hypothetical protein
VIIVPGKHKKEERREMTVEENKIREGDGTNVYPFGAGIIFFKF